MRVCVILVLDATRSSERSDREARHVARREHVVSPAGPPVLVDENAVVDLEAGGLSELCHRDDSEPGDDRLRFDRRSALRRHETRRDLLDALARENRDALLAVVVVDECREVCGEETCADPVVREDDRHVASVRRESGRDLRADEAAADHGHPQPVAGELREDGGSRRACGSRRRRRRPKAASSACHRLRAAPSRTRASRPCRRSRSVRRGRVRRLGGRCGARRRARASRGTPSSLPSRSTGPSSEAAARTARVAQRRACRSSRTRRDREFRGTRSRPSYLRRRSGTGTPPSVRDRNRRRSACAL